MALVLNRLARMAPELVVRTILIGLTAVLLYGIVREWFEIEVPGLAWLVAAAAFWLLMTIGLYGRAGEASFAPWRRLSRQEKMRRWAGALWTTPLALFFPFWLLLFYEPSILIEHWDTYILLFGLPFAAAAALYLFSVRATALR